MNIELKVNSVAEMGNKAEAFRNLFDVAPSVAVRGVFHTRNGETVFLRNFRDAINCGRKWFSALVDGEKLEMQATEPFDVLLRKPE